ncbi:MAG: RsmB/NOP family class I SAM-dependent RNA methyltransferase [Synoicihabitans sp.]
MSRVTNQRRLFLELMAELRPWWRQDAGLPNRLNAWLARHRAGSRDRRLYRELAYTAWRILPWIEDASDEILIARVANHAEETTATAAYIEAFRDTSCADPADPIELFPSWLNDQCPATENPAVREKLLERAPLWIRLQTKNQDEVAREFRDHDIPFDPSAQIPSAWRLPRGAPVSNTEAFRNGLIEVQDIGSQAILWSLPGLTGQNWLDACAGAGGKTLQLAQLVGPEGTVVAHDVRPKALKELQMRQQRAGFGNITTTRNVTGRYSGVLVDAPCSGSGTWRRSPHLKWTTKPEQITRATERQLFLLGQYSQFVMTDGILVYATCSLCRTENDGVADQFEQSHPEFRPLPLRSPGLSAPHESARLTLFPGDLDSDAYFVAAWKRS